MVVSSFASCTVLKCSKAWTLYLIENKIPVLLLELLMRIITDSPTCKNRTARTHALTHACIHRHTDRHTPTHLTVDEVEAAD